MKLYRVSCAACGSIFRAVTVDRLGKKVAAHCCWSTG